MSLGQALPLWSLYGPTHQLGLGDLHTGYNNEEQDIMAPGRVRTQQTVDVLMMLLSDNYSTGSRDQTKGREGGWGWVPRMATVQGCHCLVTFSHHPTPTHWEVMLVVPSKPTQNPWPPPPPAPCHQHPSPAQLQQLLAGFPTSTSGPETILFLLPTEGSF